MGAESPDKPIPEVKVDRHLNHADGRKHFTRSRPKVCSKPKGANRYLTRDIGKTMMRRQDPGPVKASVMWGDRLVKFI